MTMAYIEREHLTKNAQASPIEIAAPNKTRRGPQYCLLLAAPPAFTFRILRARHQEATSVNMKSEGPIYTDDDWMTRRMKETADCIPGCRAEIRPASEGSPHLGCDLWLFYEDAAARERINDALECLNSRVRRGSAITGRQIKAMAQAREE